MHARQTALVNLGFSEPKDPSLVSEDRVETLKSLVEDFHKGSPKSHIQLFIANLYAKCPNTYKKAYPHHSREDWLRHVIINYIEAHAATDPRVKIYAFLALRRIVKDHALNLLPFSDVYEDGKTIK